MVTIEKKLDRWTKDCMFEKLNKLHKDLTVVFETPSVKWHISNHNGTCYILRNKVGIGYVDIETGRVASNNNSIMERKLIQNLVDRINKGPQNEWCKLYMEAIRLRYKGNVEIAQLKLDLVIEELNDIKQQ